MHHETPTIFKDPVCGMRVSPKAAVAATEYLRKQYYFCCDHCREAFEADPERYLYHLPSAAEPPRNTARSESLEREVP